MNVKITKALNRHDVLTKEQMKRVIGGRAIVLCGGQGNYVERCACGGGTSAFYCCHNSVSTCVSETCGTHGHVCTRNTPLPN